MLVQRHRVRDFVVLDRVLSFLMQYSKVGEGEEQQLRVSPYTTASFARLLCHSLRFLKLDMSHFQQVGWDWGTQGKEAC